MRAALATAGQIGPATLNYGMTVAANLPAKVRSHFDTNVGSGFRTKVRCAHPTKAAISGMDAGSVIG